jgi:hypothetical protein
MNWEPVGCPGGDCLWFSVDYLLWWTKDNRLPPLLTTGSPQDAQPGALGQPGTQILFGGAIDSEDRSGGRFQVGYWFTDDKLIGVDGGFFFLGQRSATFTATSPGDSVLAVPFFNVNTGDAGAFHLALPGQRAGSFQAELTDRFWGAETNLRCLIHADPVLQVQVLGGFRYVELTETLTTATDSISLPAGNPWELVSAERFATRNYFYGGQLGTETTWRLGRLTLDLLGKVALGGTHQVAVIDGNSVLQAGGQNTPLPFGRLAAPSNIGHYSRDIFTVVPEAGVTLGYQVTRHMRATVGYTFLFLSDAVRPGDLIDPAVNPTQFKAALGLGQQTGPARPAFPGNASDYWAQGLNLGLEFHY